MKPDFSSMTAAEARAYLLEHRTDPEALQAFLEKSRALNPNPRTYGPDDNISDAINEYLAEQAQRRKDQDQQASS